MYQYKREPLDSRETNLLANACQTLKEKFVIWALLDAGLRVSELAGLTRHNVQWQENRLLVFGNGGPSGTMSKRRIVPMSDRVRAVLEAVLALKDTLGMSIRPSSGWLSMWPRGLALPSQSRRTAYATRMR